MLGNGFLPMFASGGGAVATLTGATWALDGSGRAYNVPTLGSELLTNTEFTSDTIGWLAANNAVLTRRDFSISPNIAPTGGADNFGLEIAHGGTSAPGARVQPALVVGNWYSISVRAFAPSANADTLTAGTQLAQPVGISKAVATEDSWQTVAQTGRATLTAGDLRLRYIGSTAGGIAYFDSPSFRAITLATTLATVAGTTPAQTAAARIHTLTSGTQAGVASLLDSASNPQNFLIAYHDGTNVRLDKCVAGTYTNLITTAVAFTSLAQIEIRRPSGNTFQLWYNGTQRGTDQTVSDAGIINNTIYGLFSTLSGNLFTEFTLDGAVIPFGF